MDASIPCPECGRITRLPEVHLGRRFKCPGCGAIVASKRPEASEPYAPPRAKIGPNSPPGAEGEKGPGWHFHVKVKRDPARLLKGMLKAEVAPRGLVLRVPKKGTEVARVPVGTPGRHEGGASIAIELDGREVTLVVSQGNLYTPRLAEDVVGFLNRARGRPVAGDYAMPRSLLVAAYSPLGIGIIGMTRGAIGGGIGGGIAGGLLTANLAIIRKESWSLGSRIGACLALSLGGYVAAVAIFVAIALQLRPPDNPPPEPTRFGPVAANPPAAPPSVFAPRPAPIPAPFPPAPGPLAPVGPPGPPAASEPKTPEPATGMDGLIGYWPLDEGAGSNATDASGLGHEGTLTKGRRVDGIRGGAVEFDGDGFLDLGDSPGFNIARGRSFTIAGWFRSADWTGPLVSHRLARDGAPVIDITLEDRTVAATVRQDGDETPIVARLAGRPIRDDRWHHFALVRHGGDDVELYLDGAMQGRATGPNIGGPITTDLRSAGSERYWVKTGWPEPHYLKGAIDELCLFERDLKAEEIRALAGR